MNSLSMKVEEVFRDRERRNLLIALLLSLLFHILLLFIVNVLDWLVIDMSPGEEQVSEPVTFIFPENKPKQIVENMNENEMVPENSDLLSERNSRAANPDILDAIGLRPNSRGNIPIPNLSRPFSPPSMMQRPSSKVFNRRALAGEAGSIAEFENSAQDERLSSPASNGTNQLLEQKQFSADQLGDLSLSTYAWEWAPYINAFKQKLLRVWYAPVAYYRLGLIHGYTIIKFTISRDGRLTDLKILDQKGHESLHLSSESAIRAVFPFKALPTGFPDRDLTITARMIYPNLRQRSY